MAEVSSSQATCEYQKCSLSYGDMVNQLARTLAAANRYIMQLLAEEGIEGLVPSHGDILDQLFNHDGLPMAALAEAIGKDPSTVTALVRKLSEAGYVTTAKNSVDRRVTEVRLTDAGRALAASAMQVSERLLATMFDGLIDSELSQTKATLIAMRNNFEKEGK